MNLPLLNSLGSLLYVWPYLHPLIGACRQTGLQISLKFEISALVPYQRHAEVSSHRNSLLDGILELQYRVLHHKPIDTARQA
jgi:hypothetical protein